MAQKLSSEEKQNMKCTIHVLPNTHWDREWRFPFQETRLYLLDLVDRMLALMETQPEYQYFNFDSQTVFLDDYLELKPGNRERLARLISDKRLIVGPWYTLPEMNVIHGESIVRNLLMGQRIGDAFGNTGRVGYTPTSYGQVSQIAQIYDGFDIDGIIFYRGLHDVECDNEYILEGADGTQILGIRVSPNVGRGAFYLYVEARTMHEDGYQGYRWDMGHLPFHVCRAECDHEEEPRLLASPFAETFNPKPIAEGVQAAMDEALRDATSPVLCLFDGMDSTGPNQYLPRILKECNKVNPDWEFRLSSLPVYLEHLKENLDRSRLKVLKGERRRPSHDKAFNAFLKDSMSSRMYLKIRNAQVERALAIWAEPFSVLAAHQGHPYNEVALVMAWKHVLANHSHDSIGGLSPDQIHKDMGHKFDQAFLLGDGLMKQSLGAIVSGIDTSDADAGDVMITVFNPTPQTRDEVVDCYIDLPRDEEVGYTPFSIYDAEGNTIIQQVLGREQSYLIATEKTVLPMAFDTWKWHVAFETKALPPMGFATYTVKKIDAPRKLNYGTQCAATNVMENEFLRVAIEPNGTLTVTEKASGEVYRNLNFFEDNGECGDPWWHWAPPSDRFFNTLGSRAEIVKEEDGPVLTRFSVKVRLPLPVGVADTKMERRDEMDVVAITSQVTLRRGVPRIEVKTVIDNTVKDHRLRMMAEAGFRAEASHAHCQFDVVERPTELEDTSEWLEMQTGTNPMNGYHGAFNGQRGLAVLSLGLTEYEVRPDEVGTIATTLMRNYQYPKMNALLREGRVERVGNEGSQMPGKQDFEYAFCFHADSWEKAGLMKQMNAFRYPVIPTHHGRHEGKLFGKRQSFLRLEPENLCLTTMKKAETRPSVIVRFYNPTGQTLEGSLWSHYEIKEAYLNNLKEDRGLALPVAEGHQISLSVAPKKIITLELVMPTAFAG